MTNRMHSDYSSYRPLLLAIAVLAWTSPILCAQFESPPVTGGQSEQDPLAARQQIARDRMVQLEDRMYRLVEKLAAGEPEQAKRLEEALRRSKELLIRRNMDEVIDLLEKGDLSTASDKETTIGKGIQQLLAILLAETDRTKELKQESDRLRAFEQKIAELIEEQRHLKDQLDPASAPADAQSAAGKQHDLAQRADQLADQMQGNKGSQDQPASEQADASSSRPSSNPSESSDQNRQQSGDKQSDSSGQEKSEQGDPTAPNEPTAPGTENVQKAEQHMNQAAEQLRGKQGQQAHGEQQKAIDELEEARRQLRETLDQLRREQQEEILRGLESRFTAMLAKQEAVNRQTADLDAKGRPAWTRADDLAVGGLARDEEKLAGEADEALHILEEEGTTIVFPQVVEELRDGLKEVAARLSNRQTGGLTAQLQADIIELLKELIAAVQQLRQQNEAGSSAQAMPAQPDGPPPLLPGSAELKLLRSCQVRVNRMTAQLEAAASDGGESPHDREARTRKVAERQREVGEMTRKMNERVTGQ